MLSASYGRVILPLLEFYYFSLQLWLAEEHPLFAVYEKITHYDIKVSLRPHRLLPRSTFLVACFTHCGHSGQNQDAGRSGILCPEEGGPWRQSGFVVWFFEIICIFAQNYRKGRKHDGVASN